ncbi:MAG: hypothetical protein KDA54_02380 [Phycisphaerales bacterium]|nr:hypothetical protein [Phycisphaerales bacterium]
MNTSHHSYATRRIFRGRMLIGLFAFLLLGTGCAESKKSDWTGTWRSEGRGPGGKLECVVAPIEGEQWRATLTGYNNNDVAYKVQLDGREKEKKIFFQGRADLGDASGAEYIWTGQMYGDTFVGFYSGPRGKKAGNFSMRRK